MANDVNGAPRGPEPSKGYELLAFRSKKKLGEQVKARTASNVAGLVGAAASQRIFERLYTLNGQLERQEITEREWDVQVRLMVEKEVPPDGAIKKIVWGLIYWTAPHFSSGLEAAVRRRFGLLEQDRQWLVASHLEKIKPKKVSG